MFENTHAALTWLRNTLDWAPDAAVATVVMAIAALVALLLHAAIEQSLRRFARGRYPFLGTLLTATRRPTRAALLIIALTVALPTAPLDKELTAALTKIFLLSTIVLIGWVAITTVNVAAEFYLQRFRIDVADNLLARKHRTQINILKRSAITLLTVVTAAAALMTFESVRQYGVSLFASAGVAGLVVGFAARPVLSNLIAGVQMAITQPIRIDDVVIVEGEWGRIEEITLTYVVVCIWDLRRLIVPLTYFIEKPFQNWTRASADLLGTVFVYVDYTVPVDRVRAKVEELVKASPLWDGKVVGLQVTDTKSDTLELRALASAANSGDAWNLRCELREKLIDFLQREYPGSLPKRREHVVAELKMAEPT
jgi:small-conductance mechanosensitive channel